MIYFTVPDKWLVEVIPLNRPPWDPDQQYWGVTNDATRVIRNAGGRVIGDGSAILPSLLQIAFEDTDADVASVFKLTHL